MLLTFHIFIFSRITGQTSTKPGTTHPLGIQDCSNYIDSNKNLLLVQIKNKTIKIKLRKTSFNEVFQLCSNDGGRHFQRGDNIITNSKIKLTKLEKNPFLLNHRVNLNTSFHKAGDVLF